MLPKKSALLWQVFSERVNKMGRKSSLRLFSKAFVTGFLLFLAGVLPVLIISKGKYIFFGDYSVQYIPFMNYIPELYKSGLPAFDWNADLGMNTIGTYAYYGLASPYTFLLLLFPSGLLPYGITLVNAVKFGVCSLTACIYAGQYVKKDSSAYISGVLYAFSGIMFYNTVFGFSDVISLFPLLLFAFDKLCSQRKSGGFAVMLAVLAVTNYYFFWGICVFIVIYFIVNTLTKRFKSDLKLFFKIVLESIIGTGLSAVILLPSFFSLMGNTRASRLIFDSNLLAYESPGTILKIIQSMFMPPDLCNQGIFFSDYQLDIASVSLFIPLFSIVGVSYFIRTSKKSGFSVLLYVCGIFASVPVLNSIFSAFNQNYYARWFYMPMLIMTVMTGKYLDDFEHIEIKNELKIIAVVLGIFTAYGIFLIADGKVQSSTVTYLIFILVFSALSALVLYMLRYKPDGFVTPKNLNRIVCVFCTIPFLMFSCIETFQTESGQCVQNSDNMNYNGGQPVTINDSVFFRTSTSENYNSDAYINWGYPSIDMYSSTITGSISDFWAMAGRHRSSNSELDFNDYPACSLLSVKYDVYFNKPLAGGVVVEPEDVPYCRKGFEKTDVINNYIIYKNNYFIPMGFTFDYYINEKDFDRLETDSGKVVKIDDNAIESYHKVEYPVIQKNEKLMLKGICLDDEQIEKYSGILSELPDNLKNDTSDTAYYNDCRNRAESAGYEFTADKNGFTSKINLPKENLVFYSVPYDKGFTAYVDGKETEIEKVFGGLSAVLVPQGNHTIRFEYKIRGLDTGIIISLSSLFALITYTTINYFRRKRS